MKKHSNLYKLTLAALAASMLCPSFAQQEDASVNVRQYLQENPSPAKSNAEAADTADTPFNAVNQPQKTFVDVLAKAVTPEKGDSVSTHPAPTTTITVPKIESNTKSKVFPANTSQAATNIDENGQYVPVDIPTPEEINQNSFTALKQNAFPLSPQQIQVLHNMLDETQQATAAAPHNSPPEPVSSSLMVNLAPGSTPPAIRLARGFVSSLVFVDTTGSPWPITAYDLGNPNAFNVAWDTKDNLLMVQAQTSYHYGNLAVKLKDLDTPVMLTLVPGQRAVDYRVDLRIMARGPNAKAVYSGANNVMPAGTNPILLNILDAIPPPGAKLLQVPDATTQAWLYDDKVYLRTEYTLLSPAWLAKLSSADGMNAYELIKTPLVLLSRHGKTIQTKLEGF